MRFDHKFTVPVPPSEAWSVLVDVERVVPCLPGATLVEVTDRDVRGKLRVRVGPVTVTYQGTARFTERDEQNHRAVIAAQAREARGSGTATVTITAELRDQDGHTEVAVRTELALTGRLAQSGHAALDDVGNRLVRRFASQVAELMADPATPATPADPATPVDSDSQAEVDVPGDARATDPDPAAGAPSPAQPGPVAATPPAPVDTPPVDAVPAARLGGTIGASLADEPPGLFPERRPAVRRAVPVLAVLLLLVLLIRRRRSRS